MKKHLFHVLLLTLIMFSITRAQQPETYWGLSWEMSVSQVDSTLAPVLKEKKKATKTNFTDNRQLSGYSYAIADKGVDKIYVWFNLLQGTKVSIHSIDVIYKFDYPYDAQRFKQAYFEKYGHVFELDSEAYTVDSGGSVLLRLVKEAPAGKLGESVYQLSMLSPFPFETNSEDSDFLF